MYSLIFRLVLTCLAVTIRHSVTWQVDRPLDYILYNCYLYFFASLSNLLLNLSSPLFIYYEVMFLILSTVDKTSLYLHFFKSFLLFRITK